MVYAKLKEIFQFRNICKKPQMEEGQLGTISYWYCIFFNAFLSDHIITTGKGVRRQKFQNDCVNIPN